MLLGEDGFGSWPPDLFSLDNWLRLQAGRNPIVTIQDEFYLTGLPREWTIAERKYALIIRDPLTHKFDRKILEWLSDQNNEGLSGDLNNLHQELEVKWRFRIYIPRAVLDNVEEALSRLELGLIRRPWRPIFPKPQTIRDLRKGFGHLIIDRKTQQIINTGYEDTGLIFCRPPIIPIGIDPTMLTLHDADRVMKAVWDIVKSEIKKLQGEHRQGWTPVSPGGEPEALAKVLRSRPTNFEKYLKWYDLHVAGLPFRLIAHYESAIEDPERREIIFEKVIGARKNPKVRKPVKIESAVKKGFALFQLAIHRKKSLDDEDKFSLFKPFKCPDHKDNNCSPDCEHFVKWMKDYNKCFKDFCPRETPTDPTVLEALQHKSTKG